jgi:hypothetical protein
MKFGSRATVEALVAISFLSCLFVSAQVPVNLADVDPLKDCNRREVKRMLRRSYADGFWMLTDQT